MPSSFFWTSFVVVVAILIAISPGQPEWMDAPPQIEKTDDDKMIRFLGGDEKTWLRGQVHYPTETTSSNNKLIVLAHGLGLASDCGLDPFVNAFTQAGFTAFTFDYATFGASEGMPRHQVDPTKHVADLRAAIRMLRNSGLENVDATNIGLWGTSLGGGHVLMTAYLDPTIAAVVALVPQVQSGAESIISSIFSNPFYVVLGMLKFLPTAFKELIWHFALKKVWYTPLTGPPGSAALMQNPGDEQGYLSLVPKDGGKYNWKNGCCYGSGLRVLHYRPMDHVHQIRTNTPVMLIAAQNDTLCPAKAVSKAAKLIQNSELLVLPNLGHFDVYSGDGFQQHIGETVRFFKKHLLAKQQLPTNNINS